MRLLEASSVTYSMLGHLEWLADDRDDPHRKSIRLLDIAGYGKLQENRLGLVKESGHISFHVLS